MKLLDQLTAVRQLLQRRRDQFAGGVWDPVASRRLEAVDVVDAQIKDFIAECEQDRGIVEDAAPPVEAPDMSLAAAVDGIARLEARLSAGPATDATLQAGEALRDLHHAIARALCLYLRVIGEQIQAQRTGGNP